MCVSLVLLCTTYLPLRQISDVADGLNFLHSYNVVHGNLNEVRDRPISRSTTVLTAPSRTSLWMLPVAHGSLVLVLPPPHKTPVRCVTHHGGSHQRSWMGGASTARKGTFSHLQSSRSWFVVYGQFDTDNRLIIPQ